MDRKNYSQYQGNQNGKLGKINAVDITHNKELDSGNWNLRD